MNMTVKTLSTILLGLSLAIGVSHLQSKTSGIESYDPLTIHTKKLTKDDCLWLSKEYVKVNVQVRLLVGSDQGLIRVACKNQGVSISRQEN